jgi:hypothetical protein
MSDARLFPALVLFLLLAAVRAEADIHGYWVLADGLAAVRLEATG